MSALFYPTQKLVMGKTCFKSPVLGFWILDYLSQSLRLRLSWSEPKRVSLNFPSIDPCEFITKPCNQDDSTLK